MEQSILEIERRITEANAKLSDSTNQEISKIRTFRDDLNPDDERLRGKSTSEYNLLHL